MRSKRLVNRDRDEYGSWKGPLKPSSEWRIHLDIAHARPDIGAIVRFQSPYATALAMARKDIPAAHSMIALFGGPVVRCAKYAPGGNNGARGSDARGAGPKSCRPAQQLLRIDDRRNTGAALVRARELETLADFMPSPFQSADRRFRRRGSRPHRRAPEVKQRRRSSPHCTAYRNKDENQSRSPRPNT